MAYLITIAAVFLFLLIIMAIGRAAKRKKLLEALKAGWGKPKTDYLSFDEIGMYALQNKETCFHKLTNQTLTDIDFEELFALIDRTTSKIGQQYLYDRLQKPENNVTGLKELGSKADFFADNSGVRDAVQQLLLSLSDSSAYYVSGLLKENLIERPGWVKLLAADTFLVILMLLLSPKYPALLIWMMVPLALNMGLHFWNKNNTYRFIRSLPYLNKLIHTADELVTKPVPFEIEKAKKAAADLRTFQRKLRLISFGQQGAMADLSQIFFYFVEVVKALFLVELHGFYSIMQELENKQQSVLDLFQFVGEIDMTISIASLRAGNLKTCVPEFISAGKKLSGTKLYHPLIDNCVTNDLIVNGKGILITGSNMSGKTTFLRTVAVNSLLAQTIYTCFAESFAVPLLKLSSSIRIDDSIEDGKSYYLAEVDVMSALIQSVKPGEQNLFIMDEVFKGTNTIERIAAGKAILSFLNRENNIVLVSTHDIELSDMLTDEYDLYHFSETIQDNRLYFDHLLKAGQLKTRNAIRILEMADYPPEIIEEAREISGKISMTGL